jgi:hypothetical protein
MPTIQLSLLKIPVENPRNLLISQSIIQRYVPICLLLIAVNSHGNSFSFGNMGVWWAVQFVLLLFFLMIKWNFSKPDFSKIINYYLLYVLFSMVRGVIGAEGYWDWKSLIGNSMSLLIPMAAFVSASPNLLQLVLNRYIYVTAPLFLVLQFFLGKDEYGFFLAPFTFLFLFFPTLSYKWKIASIGIAIYVIFADFGARSNVIKFALPLVISLLYYFRTIFSIRFLNFVRILLIGVPIVFFTLGVTGRFNIFNPYGESSVQLIEKKRDFQGDKIEENLLADTRTFLYTEVLFTAQKYDSWILGRNPANGNISDAFGEDDPKKKNERNANEVGILNYFTWLGIVGVGFMFLIYYQASLIALRYSNNYYSKIFGLYVAFRWAYLWVEDMSNFHIQFVYLWFIIGFCFSENFRKMTDEEIHQWVQGVFKR